VIDSSAIFNHDAYFPTLEKRDDLIIEYLSKHAVVCPPWYFMPKEGAIKIVSRSQL